MRSFNIILFALLLNVSWCSKSIKMDSPLVVVIKLHAAESVGNLDEAVKYINVEKVYSKLATNDLTAREVWIEKVTFDQSLENSKKFTNQFKYYNFEIQEQVNGNIASVLFKSLNPKSKVQSITYSLEQSDDAWVIVDIEYSGFR